jgi:hypothetical protein
MTISFDFSFGFLPKGTKLLPLGPYSGAGDGSWSFGLSAIWDQNSETGSLGGSYLHNAPYISTSVGRRLGTQVLFPQQHISQIISNKNPARVRASPPPLRTGTTRPSRFTSTQQCCNIATRIRFARASMAMSGTRVLMLRLNCRLGPVRGSRGLNSLQIGSQGRAPRIPFLRAFGVDQRRVRWIFTRGSP